METPSSSSRSVSPVLAGGTGVPFESGGEFLALDECERGVIELFVSVADLLGFPRSLGEIYGLAYLSPEPIHFAEVCGRLAMSKGSASQGLRTLRDLGALKPVYVPGDRRDYFEPEIKIRVLLERLLSERLRPHLERGPETLERLKGAAERLEGPEGLKKFRQDRVKLLAAWQKRTATFLPLLQKILR